MKPWLLFRWTSVKPISLGSVLIRSPNPPVDYLNLDFVLFIYPVNMSYSGPVIFKLYYQQPQASLRCARGLIGRICDLSSLLRTEPVGLIFWDIMKNLAWRKGVRCSNRLLKTTILAFRCFWILMVKACFNKIIPCIGPSPMRESLYAQEVPLTN